MSEIEQKIREINQKHREQLHSGHITELLAIIDALRHKNTIALNILHNTGNYHLFEDYFDQEGVYVKR